MIKVLRLKDIGIFKGGLTYSPENICDKEEGILVLRSSNIQNSKISLLDNVYVNCEVSSDLLIKKGDLLICSRNGSANLVGKTAQIEDDIHATWGAFMMIFRTSYNSRYTYYLLNDSITKNKGLFSTSTINQLTNSMLGNIYVNFELDISEQEKIERYLDTKVGEIDQKVSLIEKKIERYQLLKKSIINKVVTKGLHPEASLKESQISWLGQIPEHWEEKRLKDLGYFYGGLSGKSGEDFQNEDEDVIKPFIPYTNILNNFYVNPEVVKYVVINDNESQNTIQKGDLLFLMSSEDYESIAKASVVNEEVDELYLNSFCKGMRITNKQIYSPFLCYLLSNNNCRDSLRFEAQGFTRINIKTGKVACASIIIPPLSEQQEIASYLDQKCADIDAIIANCTAQIEKYKTLKRALINEVVTGQRTIE